MALSRTLLEASSTNTGLDGTQDTGSFSPTSGALLIIDVHEVDAGPGFAAPTLSDSVDSLTYTQVATVQFDDGSTETHRITRFRAVASSGSSRSILITSASTPSALAWSVREYTGQDGTTPVVQSNTASGNSATPATTLSAFGSANNWTDFAAGGFTALSTITLNGMTASDAQHNASDSLQYRAGHYEGNDTAPDASCTSSYWGCVACEIAEASGGGLSIPIAAHYYAQQG